MVSEMGRGRDVGIGLGGAESVEEVDVSAVVFNALDHVEAGWDFVVFLLVLVLVV